MIPTDEFDIDLRERFARAADAVPPGTAKRVMSQSYRPRAHHPALFSGVTAVLVVAAATGAVTLGGPSHHAAAPTPAATSRLPHISLAAKVTAAVQDVSDDVFRIKGSMDDGTQFVDYSTGDGKQTRITSYDANGNEQLDVDYVTAGDRQSSTTVDYSSRTYTHVRYPQRVVAEECQSANCDPSQTGGIPPGNVLEGAPLSTVGVQWLINHDDVRAAPGTQQVDGVATKQLTFTPKGTQYLPRWASATMWIDQGTNLPVQVELDDAAGRMLERSDVSWLPPTPDSLAKLRAPIPAGFTESNG